MTKRQLKDAIIILTTFAAEQQKFVTMEELDERMFPSDCFEILVMDTYEGDDFEESQEPTFGYNVADSIIRGLRKLGFINFLLSRN